MTTSTVLSPPIGRVRPAPARWLRALFRGREADARWVRPALLTLLGATAFLYLWDLGASGWANSFYSAAVQAGTVSWKAFFFGSFDASNFITVDKPPASLWVMELSTRLFGVSSWSILAPQALEGVAAVGLLYATVRRWFTPAAALIAGAVLALTPVAALMFRFNNPDALLVLLMVGATYATVRALERGRTRWLALAAALVGTGFLTKMLQADLVVPALALTYLIAAPVSLRRRLVQLLIAGGVLVVASGWWVAIVQLIPASARPYIGGSQDNSLLNLIFGYNGFGRLSGSETGSVGGGGVAGSMWGPTGWNRLFLSSFGGQISWLMPAALILLGGGLWLTRRLPRVDRTRAALLLWGGSLVVTALVFSFAQGIIHPYYSVALAPPTAALVGTGSVMLWQRREVLWARLVLAAALGVTAVWSYALLAESSTWLPPLRYLVIGVGLGASVLIVGAPLLRRGLLVATVSAALVAGLAGPAAYSIDTVLTPHTGAIPSAGPALDAAALAGNGGAGGGRIGAPPAGFAGGNQGFGPGGGGFGGAPPAGFGPPPGAGAVTGGGPGGGGPGGGAGGGLLNASTPGAALVALLDASSSKYTWVAAAVGANSAAGYQLASDRAVMAIGGFNGTDPYPTLSQFESLVASGAVHYFIADSGGGRGGPAASSSTSAITQWVESHFASSTVDGMTLYDLSSPSS